jgi:hypothetical protein
VFNIQSHQLEKPAFERTAITKDMAEQESFEQQGGPERGQDRRRCCAAGMLTTPEIFQIPRQRNPFSDTNEHQRTRLNFLERVMRGCYANAALKLDESSILLILLVRSGFGAGDGNRTHVASLEGWSSTIELHPRPSAIYGNRGKPPVNANHNKAEA